MTTILLVDDDPMQAFRRMSALEKKFRDVQRVADPAEAFCMVEQPQFAGQLGLVIADLRKPGVGAPEFVAELHARLPHVPVIVLYAPGEAENYFECDGVVVLPQPVASEELLAAASQMLEQAAA